MTAQNNKKHSSFISDLSLKQHVAPFFKKQTEEDELNSCQNMSDPNSVPSQHALEQAATNKLLMWFGRFVYNRCFRIIFLTPEDPVRWLQSVDTTLQQWTVPFLTPANVIFLYMVCREAISSNLVTKQELRAVLMTCLYISYLYTGAKTSYPAKFFLIESRKEDFWNRCLAIIDATSAKMVRINNDPVYYAQMFAHLKAEGDWEER